MTEQPVADDDRVETAGHDHGDVTAGWLRPAVFGAMDGLVSNFALIAGVAGGTSGPNTHAVALAGLAGLAAGAFSMAAGEYTSVASQAEYTRAEIEIERREIRLRPEAEEAELTQMYVDRGLSPDLAAEMARQIHANPDLAVAVHSREEFGADPDHLPKPMLAAVSSFVSFAVGAVLPLLTYLFGIDSLAPPTIITLAALFTCGAVVSRVTVRSWWYGGLRQLLLGAAAAGLTYLIGDAVGASIG